MLYGYRNNISKEWQDRLNEHFETVYSPIVGKDAVPLVIHYQIEDWVGEEHFAEVSPYLFPEIKVLDVGSGFGGFVRALRKRNYEAFGVELSDFDAEFARYRVVQEVPDCNSNEIYNIGSALKLPFRSNSFDLVTFWHVIEHIDGIDKALSEACRVLKPGGRIVIVAPNYMAFRKEAHYHVQWAPYLPKGIASIYLRLRGRDPSFLQNYIHYVSKGSIRKKLKAHGLEIENETRSKIENPDAIGRNSVRKVIKILKQIGLSWFLYLYCDLKLWNPMSSTIRFSALKGEKDSNDCQ
ncbi:class I SAM-dependent methyltransferase [Curvivirga sp.]|uniref:class I SAM-dependent methyltransferase n=1 Tax=Curvivirga sp. TaxID=2856848 RepID=UPI003B5B5FC9